MSFLLRRNLSAAFLCVGLAFTGCIGGGAGEESTTSAVSSPPYCSEPVSPTPIAGSTGQGDVFPVDPMVSSGNALLSPASALLGNYAQTESLSHLTGRGVLEGAYVNVVNGVCGESHGAKSSTNDFRYPVSDPRFAEVAAYRAADLFRSELDQADSLLPAAPVKVVANCSIQDNAYYTQYYSNGTLVDYVCMGTSSKYGAGNFSHDAQVTMHELQHATTGHAYSPVVDLNRLDYDEAGALNEGISDFMALVVSEPDNMGSFDPRKFSRWALGALFTKSSARGAHRCPEYDSDYPNCGGFQSSAAGFSADQNHVSYVYPDGLGWPYAKTFSAPGYVRNTFNGSGSQQEIHQAAPIVAGVLWDIYEALKANHGGDATWARRAMIELVTEAVAHLPKPSNADVSPVTFPRFGVELNNAAATIGLSAQDRASVEAATDARGLTNAPQLGANWAAVGPGSSANAGLRFIDLAPANGIRNERFNAGDQGALWLDIANLSALTAGGLLVDVEVIGGKIRFLDSNYNYGYLSPTRAQVRYGKVNGSAIVSALASANAAYHVPTGTTYFKTDPNYGIYGFTALWVEVRSDATPGIVTLRAKIKPANGPEVTLDFPAEIR